MRVAVVTDSTASLPPGLRWDRDTGRADDLRTVPLHVVVDGVSYSEGVDPEASPARLAEAMRAGAGVTTSRPTPDAFLAAYRALAKDGFDQIVSVHLSGEMSATCESAQLAARDAPIEVAVVDTRQVAMATGYAVAAAHEVASAGGSAVVAAEAARACAERATSLFYVDTLEYLRRGGRVGAAAALLGSALAVKPLLRIDHGRIDSYEKVRTTGRCLARLADLAVEATGAADGGEAGPVDVAVAHLANPERAEGLRDRLAQRLAGALEGRTIDVTEIGAVLGAHVGPGMVAVCVRPRD